MLYQKKLLSDMSLVGAPGPLPDELQGLADESLADLSWSDVSLGYQGYGFFPDSGQGTPSGLARLVALLVSKSVITSEEAAGIA